MDDASIHAIVARLARPHPSGGKVIERAAIVAEGDSATEVVDWIIGRAGHGEAAGPARAGGLHGARFAGTVRNDGPPLRYILPAGVLD
jgi:hypothetical protein